MSRVAGAWRWLAADMLYAGCMSGGHERHGRGGMFPCPSCRRHYRYKKNLQRHRRLECGKEPQFRCPYCPYRGTQKSSLQRHVSKTHLYGVHPFR
ncbi:hypothetical protein PR048_000161 [Dryococelus australis]|uniref:C2H2-type domain-containing protein n=1 Tax=Dryococelus australis TaxID=614101 RepID=A0ABQ9IDX0_9NEOP|nr:hypothetical protein PR048_000161 [Dryococelus australis]